MHAKSFLIHQYLSPSHCSIAVVAKMSSAPLHPPIPHYKQEQIDKLYQAVHDLSRSTDPVVLPTGSLFTLFVIGDEPVQKFYLHKDIVSHFSPVLQAELKHLSQEAKSNRYEIPDESPDVFGLFMEWMYTQELDMKMLDKDVDDPSFADFSADMGALIGLWIFADKYQVRYLQNQVIDALAAIMQRWEDVGYEHYDWIWRATREDNPLRNFFVDYCLAYSEGVDIREMHDKVPAEMEFEMLVVVADELQDIGPEYDLQALKRSHYVKERQ